jgi:hypothetical protein
MRGKMEQINRPSKKAEAAVQMLVWAIEEIAKTGNKEAEKHARLALNCLSSPPRAETGALLDVEASR